MSKTSVSRSLLRTSSIATAIALTLSASSAYAWVPPERIALYAQLNDLDAFSQAPMLDGDTESVQVAGVSSELHGNASFPGIKQASTAAPVASPSIQQGVEQSAPVTMNVSTTNQPLAASGPRTTIINQTIEEAPVQGLTYAPTAQTIIHATQNIYNNNIINILQQCGDFCTQFINVQALALALANQTINGSASNTGNITQIGTFSGTGTGSSAGAQSLIQNPTANTAINNQTNVLGGNAVNILQTGTSGLQSADIDPTSMVNPFTTLNGNSTNTTSALQIQQ
jgi:hypothetical protein